MHLVLEPRELERVRAVLRFEAQRAKVLGSPCASVNAPNGLFRVRVRVRLGSPCASFNAPNGLIKTAPPPLEVSIAKTSHCNIDCI